MAVGFSVAGAVGTILLDNPPANSYDIDVMAELSAAVDEAIAHPDVKVVVLRSASEKFFSAGADVKKFLANDATVNMDMVRASHRTLGRIAEAEAVFVALIAGHALGGGLELALACDLRYAVDGGYRLGTPEVTLGLLPGNGGTQRLTRLIGLGPALDLLITGRTVTPAEAHALGIVTGVFAAEEAEERLAAIVDGLANGPRLAIASIKRAVHEGIQRPLDDGLRLERELIEQLFRSQDAIEGLTAFTEKRAPQWVGA